ncbi:MAG: hypothetical protein JWN75_731 [Candidatus Saccharibacteria bacterium]|nr:hypothetical protein [Candidatus Saccharibacteria bacterium]
MIKNWEKSEPAHLPQGEQRDVVLDIDDILDLHHGLLKTADSLWTLGSPNKQEKTAIRVPLGNQTLNTITAGKWGLYSSLSAAYLKDIAGEHIGLTFTTPQVYDAIEVKLESSNNWSLLLSGMQRPLTTYTNDQLLRLLDAKLDHNTGTLGLVNRMPQMTHDEFPAEVMNLLESLAKIRTDIRTYSAADYVITPKTYMPAVDKESPEYMSSVVAEVTRAEGVKADDYIIRLTFDGMPIQAEDPDENGNPVISHITNVYEHGFSIPSETGLTTDTYTTFSVISDSPHDNERVKQHIQSIEPERKGGDIFRRALQMVSDEHLKSLFEN